MATASAIAMPPPTIDWKALARPLRSEARSKVDPIIKTARGLN